MAFDANYDCNCVPCEELAVPAFERPCYTKNVNSQIGYLILGIEDESNPGDLAGGAVDVSDLGELLSAEASNDLNIIHGIGDVPEPEQSETEGAHFETVYGKKKYTLNFTVVDYTIENYNEARKLACGMRVQMFFATEGGFAYGDEDGHGISALITKSNPLILERGADARSAIELTLTWSSDCPPFIKPFALATEPTT